MKLTLHSSLIAYAAAMLLGAALSGCSSNGGKVDLSRMSKQQQIQAVGQKDAHTIAIENEMMAKMFGAKAKPAQAGQPGAKVTPPQITPPNIGQK